VLSVSCHTHNEQMFHTVLLSLASQRVEFLVIEWFGTPWMMPILENWKRQERGSLPRPTEYCIIFYVISKNTVHIKSNKVQGLWL
jgi:transient receptor potential cation channel subfamily C